jgi:hypothetical protein
LTGIIGVHLHIWLIAFDINDEKVGLDKQEDENGRGCCSSDNQTPSELNAPFKYWSVIKNYF